MKKIILASTSPRRQKILKEIGLEFEIKSPNFEENILGKAFSSELIENIALNKGLSVLPVYDKNSIIISADTVVVYNNLVLGKPKDYNDAFRMLQMLSGKTHNVVTSVCIINNEANKKIVKSETSEVTFNMLSKNMIENYIIKFKPYDKAGAYGIQELNKNYVKEIKGEYDNIVGLPSKLVKQMLKDIQN